MPSRDLRLLVGAVGVSSLGDYLAWVPLALLAASMGGSALAVSALFLCLWGPVVALGGVAGLVADRVENRALLLWASLAQAAVATGLCFADSLGALLVLTALLGAGVAFSAPAEFTLVPAVAGSPERVGAVNGHVETARYLGMTVGPLAGGALAAAGSIRLALALDALSFCVVAAAAWRLRARRRAEHGERSPRARDGFVFLARERALAVPVGIGVAALVFFSVSVTAELFFVRDELGAGALGYGAMITAWTLGMLLGAGVVARRVAAGMLAAGALAGVALQGAGLAGAALAPGLGLALGGFLFGGVAHGAKNVLLRTLIHERVPEHLTGRAFAAYNAARNGAELGALGLGGLLVGAIGARAALLFSGVVPLALGACGLALLITIEGRKLAHARV